MSNRIDIIEYFDSPINRDQIEFSLNPFFVSLHKVDFHYQKVPDMPDWVDAEVAAQSPRKNTWVANLQNLSYTPGHLKIGYNLTDMKNLFGIRKVGPKLGENLHDTLVKNIAPIGFIGILETSDNQIVYEVRGKSVQVPGKIIPLPAGNLEDTECSGKMQTLIEGLYQRGDREIGFNRNDMDESSISLIGIGRDRIESWNPAPTFVIRTLKTLDRVREKYQHAKNITPQEESERLIPKQIDEKILGDYVVDNAQNFVGNGIGATLLYGRFKFGGRWYMDTVGRLTEKNFVIVENNPYRN